MTKYIKSLTGSELMASALYSQSNLDMEMLFGESAGKSKYVSKFERSEELNMEFFADNLEKELEEHRIYMENEVNNFESSLSCSKKHLDYGFLESSANYSNNDDEFNLPNYSNSEEIIYKIEPKNVSNVMSFELKQNMCDIINYVYLELDMCNTNSALENTLETLDFEDKFSLLNSLLIFKVGNNVIDKKNIMTCIFNEICNGEHIREFENKIQIPIYNFNSMRNKNLSELNGFPFSYIANKNTVSFSLYTSETKFNVKLVICGTVFSNHVRIKSNLQNISNNNYEFIIVEQNQFEIFNEPNLKKKLYFNGMTKCLIFYFQPKQQEGFFDMGNDYPEVESAYLSINELEPIKYESDEILNFEIFGIKIFIVPFSKEFSNWESITECVSKPMSNIKSSSINFSRCENVKFWIDASDSIKYYFMNIYSVSLNIMRITNGFISMKYIF
jgi:hypothetical protein